jgi:aldehyde:ferredoxin oxidoreductase
VFSPSALIYATEPRASTPQLHEICGPAIKWAFWYTTQGAYSYVSTDVYRNIAKRLWGSEKAADFSTYDGKALAAVKVQNRQYAKECLILCDFVFPIFDDASSEDHVGDPSLESRIFSAATGIDTDEEELNRTGERIFNLYRAILLREGRKGRQDDYLPESQFMEREEKLYDAFGMFNPDLFLPGAGDEIVSRKGKALDRDKFKQMLDEYYEIRGWDKSTGLIKKETLQKLGLPDIIKYKQISL